MTGIGLTVLVAAAAAAFGFALPLAKIGRNRDGEDSKTNKSNFLHVQLPRKEHTTVNHKPRIRVKNRSRECNSLKPVRSLPQAARVSKSRSEIAFDGD